MNPEHDFETLLKLRLQGHQDHLDRHRVNVSQKIEWLSPNALPDKPKKSFRVDPAKNIDTAAGASTISSATTEKLALKRRIEDGVQNLNIEDSLLLRGEKNKTKKWLQAQVLYEQEVPGKPTITEFASSIPSSSIKETTNRLHQQQKMSNEKMLQLLQKELESLVKENLENTFSPAITPRAQQLSRHPNHDAFEDLYAQANKMLEYKKDLSQLRQAKREEELRSRTPTINKMSMAIADRLSESTMDRLQRPKRVNEGYSQPTSHSKRSSTSRTTMLYEDHRLRQLRKAQLELQRDQLSSEHTFTPTILQTRTPNSFSFLDRQQVWDSKRRQKIEKHIAINNEAELAGCTFAPAINTEKQFVEQTYNTIPLPLKRTHQNQGPEPHSHEPAEDDILKKAQDALKRARTASMNVSL